MAFLNKTRFRFATAFKAYAEERRVFNELSSLGDRELSDLGIARGDIATIARSTRNAF